MEGYAGLKNIHVRLFFMILVLLAGSIYAVARYKTRFGLDIKGGMRVVLEANLQDSTMRGKTWNPDELNMVAEIIRKRVDSLGVSEPVVFPKPPLQIVVELPGIKNRQEALDAIQSTAKLEFRYVPELDPGGQWTTTSLRDSSGKETDFEQILGPDGKPIPQGELDDRIFSEPPILDGNQLLPNAYVDFPNGKVVINFEFKDNAKGIFEEFTRSHIGKTLSIFLDRKLISHPVINDVIPGKGIIEGNFTPESAKNLADLLNAGALPVPLVQKDVTTIEATLGTQAVHQTLIAGIVGLSLVLIFMLIWYRMPGALADLALILYALFTFALYKLIPVTLTVPGIAGFILSIGMAVDANILIFERMKEERKSGKSLRASIESGFKRAFTAIFDSNVCTLITCFILYKFGTGQVRGFALTLAVGVIVSMFTAITCSRTFLLLLAGTNFGQNDNLYGLNLGFHPHLQVTRRMGFWFGLSGLVIVPGLIFWGMGGIKRSIEFTGGTEIKAQFPTLVSTSTLQNAMKEAGHKEASILMAGQDTAFITVDRLETPAAKAPVYNAIKQLNGNIEEDSTVAPSIGAELTKNAILAVIYASVLIILFLGIRFSIPNFWEGLKFGTCAVIALLHDVAVVWGAFAILGYFFKWQIDSLYVTALLTVIGFSVHDTIVIFDRIRENLHNKTRGESFAHVTDRSIEQTFARSINTSGTVVFTLLALLILGGPVIKLFVAALLIGVISGTYSSIFNASPLLVLWKQLTTERKPALETAGGTARPAVAKPVPARPQPVSRPRSVTTSDQSSEIDSDETSDTANSASRTKTKRRKRRM
jgi:SecD/SecF fusion protein